MDNIETCLFVFKLPDDILYGDFAVVTEYLTKNTTNDVQKARVLFTWATSIDIASLQSELEELPEEGTPLHYLLQIHWKMGNHAHLFTKLCRPAIFTVLFIVSKLKNILHL